MSTSVKLTLSFLAILFLTPLTSFSAGNHFGFNLGLGLPYTSQYGLTYVNSSNVFSVDLNYNSIKLSSGLASVSLTKPEINLKWHPFSGSFFFGIGLGQLSMEAEGTDTTTSLTAKVEVTAMTITPNMGWLWGMSDGGFVLGIDFGFQSPSSAKTTLTTTLPATNQAYIDAVKQGNDLGETALPLFTFLRVGYLF